MKSKAIKTYLIRQSLLIFLPVLMIVLVAIFSADRIRKHDQLAHEIAEIAEHFHSFSRLLNDTILTNGSSQIVLQAKFTQKHINLSLLELLATCDIMPQQCHLLEEIQRFWASIDQRSTDFLESKTIAPTDPATMHFYRSVISNSQNIILKIDILSENIDREINDITYTSWIVLVGGLLMVIIAMYTGFSNIYQSLASPLHSMVKTLTEVTADKDHLEHSLKQFLVLDARWFAGNPLHSSREIDDLIDVFRSMTHRLLELLDERHQAEAKLIAARDEAQQASLTKSQFLANMSHEIRTPMNAIIGMSHLVLETRLDDLQRNYIDKVNQSASRLLSILNDILDYSRIESGKLSVDYSDFRIEDVIHMATINIEKAAAIKEQELQVSIEDDIPKAFIGDSVRLVKVLTNLGDNAVKFTPSNGRININVSLIEETARSAKLQFEVTDNGIGMNQEQRDKLFQPFTQLDASATRRFGGTGLGLVISKALVEMMNGDIWFKSEFGKGSSFYFTVELVKQLGTISERARFIDNNYDIPQQILNLQGFQILLIEDNEVYRQQLMDMLTGNGMRVRSSPSYAESIDLLNKLDFDGIILDCEMPEQNGFEITRKIRQQKHLAGIPVIGMISSPLSSHAEKAKQTGMNDYIVKPVNIDELFAVLSTNLNPDGKQSSVVPVNEIDPAFFKLKGFDIESALQRVNGKQKVLRKSLNAFAEEYHDFEIQFNAAMLDPDPSAAEKVAFKLKIRATELGIVKLKNAVGLLELACQDSAAQVEKQLIEVVKHLNAALKEIEKFNFNEMQSPTQLISEQNDIEKLLTELYHFLEQDNTLAVEVIRKLQSMGSLSSHKKEWEQLSSAVEGYRFDEALEKLQTLCHSLDVHPPSIDC